MLLSEGIYFRKHFLWYVWQVDSKREIVPRSPQSYGIAHCASFPKALLSPNSELRFPLRFAAAMVCYRISTESSWMHRLMVLFEEKP